MGRGFPKDETLRLPSSGAFSLSLYDNISLYLVFSSGKNDFYCKSNTYLFLTEIRLPDALVGEQLCAGAGHGDVAGLEHIAAVGDL